MTTQWWACQVCRKSPVREPRGVCNECLFGHGQPAPEWWLCERCGKCTCPCCEDECRCVKRPAGGDGTASVVSGGWADGGDCTPATPTATTDGAA